MTLILVCSKYISLFNIILLFLLCIQYMCDCCGAERTLPVAADTPHGAVGQAGLHTHIT